MKAAPFAYVRPPTLSDAVAELTSAEGGGKVIAGGQSLTPVLAMRLARPETLIDINAIGGLDELVRTDDYVQIGATVRQRALERDPMSAAAVPLLKSALPWVGHREIRSRGTVCGSLAHADPAAELPAVACCLDASFVVTGPEGNRTVPARDFFSGAMTTLLEPDEILTAARFPVTRTGDGYGFAEIARRHGDFALAGVAIRVRTGSGGTDATLTGFGVSDRPVTRVVTTELDEALSACGGDLEWLETAVREALIEITDRVVDTDGDAHASRGYRRRLFHTLASRQLVTAYRKARRSADEVMS